MKLNDELNNIEIPDTYDGLTPLQQLALFWAVIVIVLKSIKIFTNDKVDKKIDLIIEWGEKNIIK